MNPQDELLLRINTAIMVFMITCLLSTYAMAHAPLPSVLKAAATISIGFFIGFSSIALLVLAADSNDSL